MSRKPGQKNYRYPDEVLNRINEFLTSKADFTTEVRPYLEEKAKELGKEYRDLYKTWINKKTRLSLSSTAKPTELVVKPESTNATKQIRMRYKSMEIDPDGKFLIFNF